MLALAAAWAGGAAAPAQARLTEVPLRFHTDYVSAVHRPTGCMARLEYHNEMLAAAYITDPLCLPFGVKMRPIPVIPDDFAVPASLRQKFRYP